MSARRSQVTRRCFAAAGPLAVAFLWTACIGDLSFNFDRCASDDDCPAGEVCEGGFGTSCAPYDHAFCSSDADCAGHDQCRYRTNDDVPASTSVPLATRKTCEVCVDDDPCPAGSICVYVSGGFLDGMLDDACQAADVCTKQSDCPADRVCRLRTLGLLFEPVTATRKTCEPKCQDDLDCVPMLCEVKTGDCVPQHCASNDDCPVYSSCDGGACGVSFCAADSDCHEGHVCRPTGESPDAGDETGACQPSIADGGQ